MVQTPQVNVPRLCQAALHPISNTTKELKTTVKILGTGSHEFASMGKQPMKIYTGVRTTEITNYESTIIS